LQQFYTLAYIILAIIVLLLVLLSYLVFIRNKRIKAEEWLVDHQEEILNFAMQRKNSLVIYDKDDGETKARGDSVADFQNPEDEDTEKSRSKSENVALLS
jgi:septation ring formation regulator EzrA